jgi:hypothetical protein
MGLFDGPHLASAFAAGFASSDWLLWKLVSSYSSATVPDFHGIPRTGLLVHTRKELPAM